MLIRSACRSTCPRAALTALALLAFCAPRAQGAVIVSRAAKGGELVTLKGVRVLRLRGTPRERGYAHGYHLAPRILAVFILYRPFLAPDDAYERRVRPEVRDRYDFPPEVALELAGMMEGIRAFLRRRDGNERALSAGPMQKLGRPFDVLDLKCMQAIADWHPFHCSAFVAWGALSPDGPVVGRNMDFGYHPVLTANHLLVYSERSGDRKAWISLTFPGIVGAITGVNEDGVAVFTLDSNAPLVDLSEAAMPPVKMLPRLLALRRILERAGPDDPAHDAMRLLGGTSTRWGQNIFIAGPGVERNAATAGVIEQTSDRTALRTAADDPVAGGVPAFACTNHFRRLVNPDCRPATCGRYDAIVARTKDLHAAGRTLDEREAFRLLWDVKQKYMTMQSVVLDLKARRIALHLFAEPFFITRPRVVRFGWGEIAGSGR